MSNLKDKLHVKKITFRSLLFLILALIAISVIGMISKYAHGKSAGIINTAHAEDCWGPTPTACDATGGTDGGGEGGGCEGGGCEGCY